MIKFFIDPILRAPTIGSMLMCLATSLIGVLVFLRKRSMLAETLSHTTYPGVALALILSSIFGKEEVSSILILGGGFVAALLGFGAIEFLEKRIKIKEDAALTFVLAAFFGLGVTLASYVQVSFPKEWQQVHTYLYGQVATLTDAYILLYALLALLVIFSLTLFYKEIKILLFDKDFAITAKVSTTKIEVLFLLLTLVAVVIGMRSVGLILITAMLIGPAIFARSFTDDFKTMLILAGASSISAAFLGNYLSYNLSSYYDLSFPLGPTIVLISTFSAFLSLLFAPKRGLLLRYFRMLKFQLESLKENLLKSMWRDQKEIYTLSDLALISGASKPALLLALFHLSAKKEVSKSSHGYFPTEMGLKKGAKIVRLHRLWEVYLVDYLGVNAQRVHKSAEEIEHILTQDLERDLTQLLHDPKHDPHDQPIPPWGLY